MCQNRAVSKFTFKSHGHSASVNGNKGHFDRITSNSSPLRYKEKITRFSRASLVLPDTPAEDSRNLSAEKWSFRVEPEN